MARPCRSRRRAWSPWVGSHPTAQHRGTHLGGGHGSNPYVLLWPEVGGGGGATSHVEMGVKCRYEVEQAAYIKLVMHAFKHPSAAVNGLLVGHLVEAPPPRPSSSSSTPCRCPTTSRCSPRSSSRSPSSRATSQRRAASPSSSTTTPTRAGTTPSSRPSPSALGTTSSATSPAPSCCCGSGAASAFVDAGTHLGRGIQGAARPWPEISAGDAPTAGPRGGPPGGAGSGAPHRHGRRSGRAEGRRKSTAEGGRSTGRGNLDHTNILKPENGPKDGSGV
ncbi:hypothetical protein ACP70R_037056 [Stipagrostis hirtigluma subsp. patula]